MNNGKTGSTIRELIKFYEQQARLIRGSAGLSEGEPVDPFRLQKKLRIQIVQIDDLSEVSEQLRRTIQAMDAKTWSAVAQELPTGILLVLVNRNQPIERARVSIFEEIAHRHFGHPPSLIESVEGRKTEAEVENEAYWTAAAVMLPSKQISQLVYKGYSVQEIAVKYGTSEELVEFRLKVLLLWNRRNSQQALQGVVSNAVTN